MIIYVRHSWNLTNSLVNVYLHVQDPEKIKTENVISFSITHFFKLQILFLLDVYRIKFNFIFYISESWLK